MNLGLKIKELRKVKKITQQDLANMLGVSYQAISRWENNITSPDISALPVLANIFNVTVDYLLDVNVSKNDEIIKDIYNQYWNLTVENKWNDAKNLLEEKVLLYPNSYFLKNELLHTYYSLLMSEDEVTYQNKIICLAEEIIANCLVDESKFSAIESLILVYANQNKHEKGKELLELLPDKSYSRDTLREYTLTGIEKDIAIQEQAFEILDSFEHVLYHLMFKKEAGLRSKFILKYKELLDIIFDNNDYGAYNYQLAFIYLQCAKDYAQVVNKEEALKYFNLSVKHLNEYFTLKDNEAVIKHTSFLVNKIEDDPHNWPLDKTVMHNDWLRTINDQVFDFMKGEIMEIYKLLK